MELITTQDAFEKAIDHMSTVGMTLVVPILTSTVKHPKDTNVLLIAASCEDSVYIFPFGTHDTKNLPIENCLRILNTPNAFVYGLRDVMHSVSLDVHEVTMLPWDMEMAFWWVGTPIVELDYDFPRSRYYHSFIDKIQHESSIIPTSVLSDMCKYFIEGNPWKDVCTSLVGDEKFTMYNETCLRNLYVIESNGIWMGDHVENTHFNPYTHTGRPSNAWGGRNYSAMKKDGLERFMMVSRYGEDGVLVQFDFDSFHVRLVDILVGNVLPHGVNLHEHLAKFYLGKTTVTDDEIRQCKSKTFQILYGGVPDEYRNDSFFGKVENVVATFWDEYVSDRLETMFFQRPTKSFGTDLNRMKVFNYMLQSLETEFNYLKIDAMHKSIYGSSAKIVLYTYDSFLIDVKKREASKTVKNLKRILETDGMMVKISHGVNYRDMILM